MKHLIFVEGKEDANFLEKYIKHIKPEISVCIENIESDKIDKSGIKDSDVNIIHIGGKDRKEELLSSKIIEHSSEKTLFIFDADTEFETRTGEISKKIENIKTIVKDKNIDIGSFLFPNNEDNGTLEHLLEKIIPKGNKPILDCWNSYKKCLNSKHPKHPALPDDKDDKDDKKAEIYAYLDALGSKKIKEAGHDREYGNKEYWELNSDALEPLKKFLEENLK
ncbi:MAG: hypothetical protein LBL71_00690 [Endomicrobium sp.]|jgi:hypothetical protein|nr:hypothetical protein [Endomicrobium sp.]